MQASKDPCNYPTAHDIKLILGHSSDSTASLQRTFQQIDRADSNNVDDLYTVPIV